MQHRLVSYYNYLFGITELFCELAFIVTACLLVTSIKMWQFAFCTLRINFANAFKTVSAGLCTALQYVRVVFIKFQQRRSEFCERVTRSTFGSTPQGGLTYSIKVPVRSIFSISEDLQKANKIDPEIVLDVMQRVSHSLNGIKSI